MGDCCIKANRCVAFGIRLRSHTEVCSLQTSPSAPGEPIGPPVIVVCWYEIRVTQSKEKSAESL